MKSASNILGIISAASFLVLGINLFIRKLKISVKREKLAIIHEITSAVFLFAGIAHMICSLLSGQKNPTGIIMGFAALVTGIAEISDCHLEHDYAAKIKKHRIFSLMLFAAIILHAICVTII